MTLRLNELAPAEGAKRDNRRLGRGIGSGVGKTGGRGVKGQKSRKSGGVRPGFEGGQTPLFQTLPKRGFTNINRKEYAVVNLEKLNNFDDGTEVTPELLQEVGMIKKVKSGVKILGRGKLEKKLTVKAHKFSNSAKEAIENNGGTVEVV